jgi:4-hydroxy-tetrahydrodipicolinate synthase
VDHEKLAERLRTVHAINVTPFREDRSVDYDLLERNIEFLIASGLGVIVPCGNTGEFYALSVEEAQAVTRFVVEHVGDRAAVLAGIGYDLGTAREMALAAQKAGADAVMIHQPVHPYLMTEGLIRYYSDIARSVEIGVVLYARHEAIDREVLSRVADIENVLAIKYVSMTFRALPIWFNPWRPPSCGSAARPTHSRTNAEHFEVRFRVRLNVGASAVEMRLG